MIELVESCFLPDEIYEDMQQQFPPEELKPRERLQKLMADSCYRLYICKSDSVDIGYIFCYTADFLMVDYFAVFRKYQSMGFGSKILKKLFERDIKGCFFEVEKINPDELCTARRQEFYKRLGCVKTEIRYLFPSYQGGIPMDLFYYPINVCYLENSEIMNFLSSLFKSIHCDVPDVELVLSKIRSSI